MDSKLVYINKYFPFAVVYFFFNSLFLPIGVLYTSLLAPFFLIWLYNNKFLFPFWFFITGTLIFAVFHFLNGVDELIYLKSYLLLLTTFIFCVTVFLYLRKTVTLRVVYRNLLLINFLFTLIAMIFYFIPSYYNIFWDNNVITNGTSSIKRLKMFTYEASYYSTLLAPIAIFYYLKIILFDVKSRWLIFMMVSIPLLLSFSLGVTISLILAIAILFLSDIKLFFIKRSIPKFIVILIIVFLLIVILLLKVFPDNILFLRIVNIFTGADTSFKGRTTDSFYLGWQVASKKSIFFGCGPGQIKVLGPDILSSFYKGHYTSANTIIPNSMAEILAIYGIFGFIIKITIEIYLFFRTRVYTNYYRLALFIFIFIYQFTGSFITNIAEYVIWILAFYAPLFSEFNKSVIIKSEAAIVPA